MELEKVVQAELDAIVSEGVVNKIIRNQLERTITSIVNGCLESYSDFGKELKKSVSEAMKINFERLKLEDYNHIVVGIVKEQLDKTLLEKATKPISATIQSYMGGLEKKNWKLSEIISEFSKEVGQENGQFNIYMVVDVPDYGDFHHIYFDDEKKRFKTECGYQLDLHNGEIYGFKAGKYITTSHKMDLTKENVHGDFNKFIFRLYASGAKIEVDEDDCQLENQSD